MRARFIEETRNIRALNEAMAALELRNNDIPGLGLISGPAGLGKTQATKWYSAQNNCPYIRATAAWTVRWMLQEICAELGQDPEYQTSKVFKQVKNELLYEPRLIFIDEADYLTTNWKLLETLRDLHDLTGSPFVIVGMGNIKNRLAKHHQFWSRISQVVDFKPLSIDEVTFITAELTDLDIPADILTKLTQNTGGYFRDVMVALSHLETLTHSNSTQKVSDQMINVTAKKMRKAG